MTSTSAPSREIDVVELQWLFSILRRWLWLVVASCLLAGAIGFGVSSWRPALYSATATLLIQPAQDTKTNEYNAIVAGERLALTYGRILQGRGVMEDVIARLRLNEKPDKLAQKITVNPVKDTLLVRLTASDSSPTQAALLANTVAESFISQIQQVQAERYIGTFRSIKERMDEVAAKSADIQSKVNNVSAAKVAAEVELKRLESLLDEYRSEYRRLQQDYERMRTAAAQNAGGVVIVDRASISGTSGSVYTATVTLLVGQSPSAAITDYSTVLAGERLAATYAQIIRGQRVMQAATALLGVDGVNVSAKALAERVTAEPVRDTQLIRLSVRDNNPNKAILAANAVAEAFINLVPMLQPEPYAAAAAEAKKGMESLSEQVAETQSKIDTLSEAKINAEAELTRLQNVLTEYRSDYRTLQQNYDSVRLTADQAADAVIVIERASVPTQPVQTRTLYTAVAAAIGLVLGFGLALIAEGLTARIRTRHDVHEALGMAPLGIIGRLAQSDRGLVAVVDPHSPAAEDFRMLAANVRSCLRHSDVDDLSEHPAKGRGRSAKSLSFHTEGTMRTLLVTSAGPAEGKTVTVSNLAVAIAESGLNVALVDADLRHPGLHVLLGLSQRPGIVESLAEGSTTGGLRTCQVAGVKVLTSGDVPPNPTELLGSQKMVLLLEDLTKRVDLVLIDSSPVLLAADTMTLAPIVDGVLLVVRAGRTSAREAREAVERLKGVGANVIGVVLNAATSDLTSHYRYYGKYHGDSRQSGMNAAPRSLGNYIERLRWTSWQS